MATQQRTVDYILEQLAALDVSARKMFGEYGLWFDGKLVALICDDQLFVKPTGAGRDYLGDVVEVPPYRGAKPSLLIDGDKLEASDWLAQLTCITAQALPQPAPKKPRKTAK